MMRSVCKQEDQTVLSPGSFQNVLPLQNSVVYGPIRSRRLGFSLGINLLPFDCKFCVFDCVYCQYGWTPHEGAVNNLKRAPELLVEIRKSLEHHRRVKTPVECITLAGNGEPTVHPDFPEIVRGLCALRDEFYPGVRLGILSNASQVHRPEIRSALDLLEERYMKLDAGDPALFNEINRPHGNFDFARMIEGLKSLKNIVIQSLFIKGSCDNSRPGDVLKWIGLIKEIRPREVQIYTIDRRPADPKLREVSVKRLKEIAVLCQTQTGIPSVVYD